MTTTSLSDQLDEHAERLAAVAGDAASAVRRLTRIANGTSSSLLPAPAMYALFGEIKTMLWDLHEITDFAPIGLRNTLTTPTLLVTDSDPASGEVRDPAESINAAEAACAQIHDALLNAAQAADHAQAAVSGQGYICDPGR